jgi:hypothetical protein
MNPMRPRDPEDVVPGWSYTITLNWRQSHSEEYGFGLKALSKTDDLDFAYTLADAQALLAFQARPIEQRHGVATRPTSRNRYYGSDGDMFTLRIRAVEDDHGRWSRRA